MGSSNSKVLGYCELQNSIPGLLINEKDFSLFYSLCKIETARTISNVLYPSSTQLFYVVISGEVYVQLSDNGNKPIQATSFTVGETIHFFNAKLNTHSTSYDAGDCLRNGDIKLSLHFKSYTHSTARVIGMDRRCYDEFKLRSQSNIYAITSFVNMKMTEFFQTSTSFQTMTAKQANIFGLLLKIRLQHTGKEIGPHIPPSPLAMHSTKRRRPILTNKIAAAAPPCVDGKTEGHFVMLLHGTGLAVPVQSDVGAIGREVQRKEAASMGLEVSPTKTHSLKFHLHTATAMSDTPKVFREPSDEEKSVSSHLRIRRRSVSSEGNTNSTTVVNYDSHVPFPAGIMMGSDYFFVRDFTYRIRAYLTTAPSVMGYLPVAAMDALCQVDARFQRVYSRNILLRSLQWVRLQVPLLMELDDWSIALLSCKITLIGKPKDEVVVKAGDPGNNAYIILSGAVKEISEIIPETSGSIRIPGSGGSRAEASYRELSGRRRRNSQATTAVVKEHMRRWSHMIGVMAVLTSQPYFNTVVVTEPTLLLCLSKSVLDQVYYNNKAKLCEGRIRLMGAEVDLQHAIDHPTGSELFQQYLTQQLAAENLTFYKAVDRYDSLCRSVVKQSEQIKQLQERLHQIPALDPLAASVDCLEDSVGSRELNPHQPTTPARTRMDTIYSKGGLSPGLHAGNSDAGSPMNSPAAYRIISKPRHITNTLRSRLSSFSRRVTVTLSELTSHPDSKTDSTSTATTHPATNHECSTDASPLLAPQSTERVEAPSHPLAPVHLALQRSDSASSLVSSASDSTTFEMESTENKLQCENDCSEVALAGTDGLARCTLPLYNNPTALPPADAAQARTPDDPNGISRSDFLLAKHDRVLAAYDYHDHRTHSPKPDPSVNWYSGSKADQFPKPAAGLKVAGSGSTDPLEHMLTSSELLEVAKARHRRLTGKIRKKLHSLHKHLDDLQRVARAILETYIYNDADHQINLPDSMRAVCIQSFTEWCESTESNEHSILDPTTTAGDQEQAETPRTSWIPDQHTVSEARVIQGFSGRKEYSATRAFRGPASRRNIVYSMDTVDLSFVDLFRDAKGEVLKLLRDDLFPRWKTTPEFRTFIAGIKPYHNSK